MGPRVLSRAGGVERRGGEVMAGLAGEQQTILIYAKSSLEKNDIPGCLHI